MKLVTARSLAAAAILFAPAIAAAAVSGPHATTTPVPLTLTDWSNGLSFPQFNPALGTLTSVKLDFSGTLQTTITVTNSSGSPSSGTANTNLQVSVQDGGSNFAVPQLNLFSPSYAYSLGAGGSSTSGLLTQSGSSSDTYTLAAILAEFTGAGTIILNAGTFTQTFLANTGGNTAAGQVTQASLTGTVTYTYDIVPAPGAAALLGLGGLIAGRRRRA